VASGYCNLELDLESGRRGDRHDHVRTLLCELTGAAEALVVNNNAAATFLALHTLARDREAIVSRGELVEIGGSYRMPDIMAAAGCRMVEVGTTNRTRLADYERALSDQTAVLLKVHTSNYRIQGYVHSPSLESLVELGRSRGVPVVHDLGSGLLAEAAPRERTEDGSPDAGVGDSVGPVFRRNTPEAAEAFAPSAASPADARWDEPSVRHGVAAGADVTLFSGDKLLGGPQAGIILGAAPLLDRIRGNPLMRTHRPDKLTLAALEATLRLYRDPDSLVERLPALRMLRISMGELQSLAEALARAIARLAPNLDVEPRTDTSFAGGGSLPTHAFPTWVVRLRHPRARGDAIAAALRRLDTPVIGRLRDESLLLDCRTIAAQDVDVIAAAVADVLRELA
jgi:L-seryl-tRNA(Ser) seleniumtransferase